jgi:AAA+ superfamily predicted ATPase
VPPDPASATPSPPELPAGYPGWARELADLYFSGTTCLFLLHGNVHDLVHCPTPAGDDYRSLPDFLTTMVFGSWDIVVGHDLAHGLRPLAGDDRQRLQKMVQQLSARLGDIGGWPRDPESLLVLLDRFVERTLVEQDASQRPSIAVVFDSAQYLVPTGDLASLTRGQSTHLVRFLSWAQNPYIKRVNIAFCLVADKLSEINPRLVESSHVAAIEVPLPEAPERECFARWIAPGEPALEQDSLAPTQAAALANGLSLVNLQVLLAQSRRPGRALDTKQFRRAKKAIIERQCRDLIEFIEPRHTLDLVVGHEAARERLRQDGALIAGGRLDVAPMGYLVCGPVGTGKSFLAECYAGSVGIPCVKLRSFRSKYVGETEGNLEQVLTVLRSLGPVVVVIDEADAALGTRESGGDSGTSARVFAMIAAQMGDTRYRGRIVWMLLTSRPDLLPIDLKRQGRAEVHIPLFYPHAEAELQSMFMAMAAKNHVPLPEKSLPALPVVGQLSGSDVESILLAAHREALCAGRSDLRGEDIERAFGQFIPSAQGLEKEFQELAAVLECSQQDFLPPEWRARLARPHGRARLQRRYRALRRLVG